MGNSQNFKVFCGNSNRQFSEQIAKELGIELAGSVVKTFADGEIAVDIKETVRGLDIFIIQSVSPPDINEALMELLIMIDAVKRASASSITVVMPYFGYSRQDRKAKGREPISAKLVANLLTVAGASRILTIDLHAKQVQGYFNIPVDNLSGSKILINHFANLHLDNVVIVSPNLNRIGLARKFAEQLDTQIAIVDKMELESGKKVSTIIGDVKGKNIIMVDDIIDTATTISNAADLLKANGAEDIYACCTHAIFSQNALELLKNSSIKKLSILDTIHHDEDKLLPNIEVLSAAKTFAESISRMAQNKSSSGLFNY